MLTNRKITNNKTTIFDQFKSEMEFFINQGRSINFLADYFFITWFHHANERKNINIFFHEVLSLLLERGTAPTDIAIFVHELKKYQNSKFSEEIDGADFYSQVIATLVGNGVDIRFFCHFVREFFSRTISLHIDSKATPYELALFAHEFREKYQNTTYSRTIETPNFFNIAVTNILLRKMPVKFFADFVKEFAKEGIERDYEHPQQPENEKQQQASPQKLSTGNAGSLSKQSFLNSNRSSYQSRKNEVWVEKKRSGPISTRS